MAFLIGGANSVTGGYEVANSCRFNNNDSAYMTKTYGSVGNQKTFTISLWTKRSELSTTIPSGQTFISYYYASTTARSDLGWSDDDRIIIGLNPTGSSWAYYYSTGKFRDPSAWYHICIAFDTTQGTDSNRLKLWVNNRQETITGGYPAENLDTGYNANGYVHQIGKYASGDAAYLDGYLAEFVVLDGTATTPSSFGEYDEDSPTIWKPKDVSGLTFGTNGFYLDFEDSGDLDDDESGNTNDFTATNLAATDQATDTPTNSFATFNSLLASQGQAFEEGNTEVDTTGSGLAGGYSSIGVANGKWYAEFKLTAWTGANRLILGVTSDASEDDRDNKYFGQTSRSYAYSSEVGQKKNNNSGSSYGDSFAIDDIIGVALDLDNLKLYFSKNGTWQDSGDPTSGATGTGAAFTVTAPASTTTGFYFFGVSDESGSHQMVTQANFGNPPYANSSDAADANGYGAFEYAPPSGYLSLCTKNLAEEG